MLKQRLIHWAQTWDARITCVGFYHLVVDHPQVGPNRGPRSGYRGSSFNGCGKQILYSRNVSSLRMVVFSWGTTRATDLAKFDSEAELTRSRFGHSRGFCRIPQKPNRFTLSHSTLCVVRCATDVSPGPSHHVSLPAQQPCGQNKTNLRLPSSSE